MQIAIYIAFSLFQYTVTEHEQSYRRYPLVMGEY